MEFIHNICPLTPLMLHANYGKNWLNSLYEVREKSNVNKQHTHLQTKTDQSKSTEASKTEEDVYEEIRFTICTLPHQMFVPFLL